MEPLLALLIGLLYAGGTYLVLRRSLFKLVLGLVLLSHGANLLIFTIGRLVRARPPIVSSGAAGLNAPAGDPLPQALILTAIVIGFGVLAFALILFHRAYRTIGTDDSDDLKVNEP